MHRSPIADMMCPSWTGVKARAPKYVVMSFTYSVSACGYGPGAHLHIRGQRSPRVEDAPKEGVTDVLPTSLHTSLPQPSQMLRNARSVSVISLECCADECHTA